MNALNPLIKRANPLYRELHVIYRNLPGTECHCERAGICCVFLPEMTCIEALQWFNIIQRMPARQKASTFQRFVEFYLTNPIRSSSCSFLADGACSIYEFRTFACRAYGMWSRKFGDTRTRESREDRKTLVQRWKQFGVSLPAVMVESEIEYCDKVRCLSEKPLSDAQLMDILQRVYGLDQLLPELRQKFEQDYHSDFSFWVACLVFGQRKAVLGKFAVIKEIVQQGTDERLQAMLEKVLSNTVF
jgi:Fe-S-cluster containining protein